MTIVVRRMRWWDIDAAMELERQLFTEDAWSAELFWSELAQHKVTHYVVATREATLVGYAGLAAYDGEAYIQTMAVAETEQRQGLGRRLLRELLVEARQRGAERAGLEVRADNSPAQALYRQFGFAPVGLRRGYYQPSGADAIVMIVEDIISSAFADLLAVSMSPRAAAR
ncbi:MAG TPA: ribosomal protein S18-alanine N-acetyltransferase [Mycobacteriales bacterium]|nr:ribosomal protein S18-alanine N-acetyltransferase [Mycobacteriales bacterium]